MDALRSEAQSRTASRPSVDREAVADAVRRLLACRDQLARARERVAAGEKREQELCAQLSGLAASLSGFVVDGQSVMIHTTPGKRPLVRIRPVAVL